MVGETQIVERDGTILARLTAEDGEGHVGAEVDLDVPEPIDPLGRRYWIPLMSVSTRAAWHAMNIHGTLKYRAMRAAGRHPWQRRPGNAGLANEVETGG
jgi:hypothetical protein